MTVLGVALAWSAIQVTLVAGAALILERAASRRGPRAGSWVATASLLIVVLLTPLPFFPSPRWTGRLTPPHVFKHLEHVDSQAVITTTTTAGAGGGLVITLSQLESLTAMLAHRAESLSQWRWGRASVWPLIVISGMCSSFLRLLLGLHGVRECRRRSVPVDDPQLIEILATICRELGITKRVDICSLSTLATPTAAAVGWFRPLILLSHDWRRWTEAEKRAVVAHEAAHIARADYAAGILAGIGLCSYFYHPLVHWMVSRLRLQQELAADAIAATIAGGRRTYLISLSRLALRQAESPRPWPASAFLSSRSHFIRRIQILNSKAPVSDRVLSAGTRAGMIGALMIVAIGVAMLRGSTSSMADEPASGTGLAKQVGASPHAARPEAFDLTYVPKGCQGFVALRPAAAFRLPGMAPYLQLLNSQIDKLIPKNTLKAEMIEQATFGISIFSRDTKAGKQGRFMVGRGMVRTVDDFDWKSFVTQTLQEFGAPAPVFQEVPFMGKVYYKTTKNSAMGPPGGCFYFPDARTVVQLDEAQIRDSIERPGSSYGGAWAQGIGWQEVQAGLVAIAFNNHDENWKLDVSADNLEEALFAPLVQNARHWYLGISGGNALILRALALCGSDQKSEEVARTLHDVIGRSQKALDDERIKTRTSTVPPKGLAHVVAIDIAKDLLRGCQIRRDGGVVQLNAITQLPLAELYKLVCEIGL